MALDTSPDTLEEFLELKTGFDVKCPPPKYQLHLSAWQILIEKVNELTNILYSTVFVKGIHFLYLICLQHSWYDFCD